MYELGTVVRRYVLMWSVAALASATGASSRAEDMSPRWRDINVKKLLPEASAIALEYSVSLFDGARETPVDPHLHKFRLGDRFIVRLVAHCDIYLYIFNEGPTGHQTCLLPEPDEQAPFVKGGQALRLPPGNDEFFEFEGPAGEDRLIVVATTKPTQNLAELTQAVFRKPDEETTPAQRAEEAHRKAQREQLLTSSIQQKVVRAYLRGVASPQAVAEFQAEVRTRNRGAIDESPRFDQGETGHFAMAVATGDASQMRLQVEIPLRSTAAPR